MYYILRHQFTLNKDLDDHQKLELDNHLIRHSQRVYRPLRDLSFQCDTCYSEICERLVEKYGGSFVELGEVDINMQ